MVGSAVLAAYVCAASRFLAYFVLGERWQRYSESALVSDLVRWLEAEIEQERLDEIAPSHDV